MYACQWSIQYWCSRCLLFKFSRSLFYQYFLWLKLNTRKSNLNLSCFLSFIRLEDVKTNKLFITDCNIATILLEIKYSVIPVTWKEFWDSCVVSGIFFSNPISTNLSTPYFVHSIRHFKFLSNIFLKASKIFSPFVCLFVCSLKLLSHLFTRPDWKREEKIF